MTKELRLAHAAPASACEPATLAERLAARRLELQQQQPTPSECDKAARGRAIARVMFGRGVYDTSAAVTIADRSHRSRRALDATHIERPRERRDAARRGLTRAGPGDDDPSEPPPPGTGRLCACGCGRDVSSKRSDALTYNASCRKRLHRQRRDTTRRPHTAVRCSCLRPIVAADAEGDEQCARCGHHLAADLAPVNGFDAVEGLMIHNGQTWRCELRVVHGPGRLSASRAEVIA